MNIAEILKDCPEGLKLYCPIYGTVIFKRINDRCDTYPIIVYMPNEDSTVSFTEDGKINDHYDGECVLFPSKENRDWSTFKIPKIRYAFKPFEKVLVRDHDDAEWVCSFYSHMEDSDKYITVNGIIWKQCIPYEGHEHLVGTSNKPELKEMVYE